jgi:hypothetical protein
MMNKKHVSSTFKSEIVFPFLKHILPNTKLQFMVHTKAAVDKTSYPSTERGNELGFNTRAPEKYHSNQITHAHKYNKQQNLITFHMRYSR